MYHRTDTKIAILGPQNGPKCHFSAITAQKHPQTLYNHIKKHILALLYVNSIKVFKKIYRNLQNPVAPDFGMVV